MSKHTPGPWYVGGFAKADGATDCAIRANGQLIAEAFGRTSQDNYEPSEANAHLIAAAPELLEMLEDFQLLAANINDSFFWGHLEKARLKSQLLISKAKGEP